MKNRFLKHLFAFLIIGFTGKTLVNAQYTISAYPPPITFTHLDLWHFNISGTLDTTMVEYYVTVRVFNDQSTLLVKSQSPNFSMVSSNLYVAPTNLGPLAPLTISYTVDGFYANIVNTGGTFPAGTYQIEYALYARPTDGEFTELTNTNSTATVESLFPPVLISVENNDTICEQYPIFTWTAAYQASSGSVLTYNFKMVEVSLSQSTYQAILSNPSYYSEFEIPNTMLTYPAYASPLVYGQQYAWQVDAVVNSQVSTSSEIWSFVYGCPADTIIDSLPHTDTYIKMKTEDYGGIYRMKDKYLPISYEERYYKETNTHLVYKVFDYQTLEQVNTHNYQLEVTEGINYYIINTCSDGMNLEDGLYIFEITDNVGVRWYMVFEKRDIECN